MVQKKVYTFHKKDNKDFLFITSSDSSMFETYKHIYFRGS